MAHRKFYFFSLALYLTAAAWSAAAVLSEGLACFTVCPSKLLFRLPCPGCGLTRAAVLLSRGDVCGALAMNPNIVFAALLAVAFPVLWVRDALCGKRLTYDLYLRVERLLHTPWLAAVIVFEAAVWINNIVQCR